MDPATIGGLLLGVCAIGVAYLLEGGHLSAIIQLPALMIVIGGTLGASIITTSMSTVKKIPTYLRIAILGQPYKGADLIDRIVELAERARRDGILGLEGELDTVKSPLFRKALQLVIDGTEVTVLRQVLENELASLEERHQRGISLFRKMGGFSPTLGIIGTVLGLVHALSNTGDATRMAGAIASAFIATLWGVGLANLFFLPVSDKLRFRHQQEITAHEIVVEGAIAIQSGDNPRMIRTRLLSFLEPEVRHGELR